MRAFSCLMQVAAATCIGIARTLVSNNMPKKKEADHQKPKSGAVELNEEELDQAQGGAVRLDPNVVSNLEKPQLSVKNTGKKIPDLEWIPQIDEW